MKKSKVIELNYDNLDFEVFVCFLSEPNYPDEYFSTVHCVTKGVTNLCLSAELKDEVRAIAIEKFRETM